MLRMFIYINCAVVKNICNEEVKKKLVRQNALNEVN